MEKYLLANVKSSFKLSKFPLPSKQLNYLLYTYRYHHILPKAYSSSLFLVLCKRMNIVPADSESYLTGLMELCKFGSMRRLDDIQIFKFKEIFMKFNRPCKWNQLQSIANFLNYYRIKDQECLKHFNNLLYGSLISLKKDERKSTYYFYALRSFFNNEVFDQEKVTLIFDKYTLFEKTMPLMQKIDLILVLKPVDTPEILSIYASFIKKNGIIEEIQQNLKEIPVEKLTNLWNHLLKLQIPSATLFNLIKVEILERKNFLTENNLYKLARVLKNSEIPIEEKKDFANILKKVFQEKIDNKCFDLKKYYEQTTFLLFLKSMELISSDEIEKFYFESFFLNPDPNLFKLTITNMVNLSQQNYDKMKKFMLWNISQILAKIDQIPANKIYEMLGGLREFMKIPNEVLGSFDLFVNNKLKKINGKKKIDDFNEIIEKFSLVFLQVFLRKTLKNQNLKKEFNDAVLEMVESLQKIGMIEKFIEIPMDFEFFSWLEPKNKEVLVVFLENNFEIFFTNEKLRIIENFYGMSEKTDQIFLKELESLMNELNSFDLCRFFWIFNKNSEMFPMEEIKAKIFSQILALPQINHLLDHLEEFNKSSEFITNIQNGFLKFRNNLNDNLNFYSMTPVIKIFRKKALFSNDFLEEMKKKVLKGDFGTTEYSLNELFKIWA